MQTFLPYPDFEKSAKVLDYRRLGKQRVEAFQILNTIEKIKSGEVFDKRQKKIGWINHPAVLMWKEHTDALKHYYNTIVEEWVRRGYNNTMKLYPIPEKIDYPDWLGNRKLHASHRSNLLRKDYTYYSKYKWKEDSSLEYVWPIKLIQQASRV